MRQQLPQRRVNGRSNRPEHRRSKDVSENAAGFISRKKNKNTLERKIREKNSTNTFLGAPGTEKY